MGIQITDLANLLLYVVWFDIDRHQFAGREGGHSPGGRNCSCRPAEAKRREENRHTKEIALSCLNTAATRSGPGGRDARREGRQQLATSSGAPVERRGDGLLAAALLLGRCCFTLFPWSLRTPPQRHEFRRPMMRSVMAGGQGGASPRLVLDLRLSNPRRDRRPHSVNRSLRLT